MNILAVDDEYHALKMMEQAIKDAVPGAMTYSCSDPISAIDVAQKMQLDVAFLDIHMPEMTGVELAKRLKDINPKINIVFATAFSEHAMEAIEIRSSGYIMKPITSDAVKVEMENLRHPIEWSKEKRVKVICFGNFEVFIDGSPVKFERKQSKEIFAYLIDKRGTSVTYPELAAIIWEDGDYDRAQQKNLQVYVASLVKTLNALGETDLILRSRQGILVNTAKIDCDYYRFLEGDVKAINSFTGQYMSAYSWAEFTLGYLESWSRKRK